jgi:hypothetical protein
MELGGQPLHTWLVQSNELFASDHISILVGGAERRIANIGVASAEFLG